MSIANRINEITTHLERDYTNIEALGIDVNVDKNIENIAKVLDNVWEAQDHVTGTGESLSLATKKGKAKVDLLGNTEQDTTTGKNLLGLTDGTYTNTGITCVVSNDELKISGTSSAPQSGASIIDIRLSNNLLPSLGTLTKSLNPSGTYAGIQTSLRGQDANTSVGLWSNDANNNNAILTGEAYWFRIQINNGVSVNCTLKAQVEVGSTATTWESYTGSSPSPSPTYPQEIHSVSGDNTIVSTGKNLLDTSSYVYKASSGAITKNGDNVTIELSGANYNFGVYIIGAINDYKGKTLTLSLKENSDGVFNPSRFINCDVNGANRSNVGNEMGSNTKLTETIQNQTYSQDYLAIRLYAVGTSGNSYVMKEPMVEESASATTYQPYQRKEYEVDLPVENVLDFDTILNYWGATYTKENGTYTLTNRGEFYANPYTLNLEVGKTYTLSGVQVAQTSGNLRLEVLKDSTIVAIQRFTDEATISGKTFTVEEGHTYKIRGNYSTGGYPMIFSKPQLEEGDKANTYTPYGTTPIELCKIGTYQDRLIRTSGKNLFSGNYSQFDSTGGTGTTYSYFKLPDDGETYTLKLTCKKTFTASRQLYLGFTANGGNNTDGYSWAISVSNGQTINAGYTNSKSYASYRFISMYGNNENVLNEIMENFDVQLEKGSSATDYEPYGSGEWYLKKILYKTNINIDGLQVYDIGTLKGSTMKVQNKIQSRTVCVLCSNAYEDLANKRENSFYENPANIMFIGSSTDTLQDLKNKFNGGTIYYPLATPTYTKIEGTLKEQLEEVWRANSYDTQTNISQVNNDLPFELIVKGLAAEETE